MRWSDLRDKMPTGISEETMELVRRATAADRAEWRTQEMVAAVLTYVGAHQVRGVLESQPPPLLRRARALLAIEGNGVRGPLNAGAAMGTPATERMSWAQSLGSGRRHAGDGAAWTAAVTAAEGRVAAAIQCAEASAGAEVSTHDVYAALDAVVSGARGDTDTNDLSFILSYARCRIAAAARRLAAALSRRGGEYDRLALLDEDSERDRQSIDDWDDVLSVVRDHFTESTSKIAVICECGEVTGDQCERPAQTIVEWMPISLRDSHENGGGRGIYPHNGARRLRVSVACAAVIVETGEGWAENLEIAVAG